MSERNLRRHLVDLERRGFIQIEERRDRLGRNTSNLYTLQSLDAGKHFCTYPDVHVTLPLTPASPYPDVHVNGDGRTRHPTLTPASPEPSLEPSVEPSLEPSSADAEGNGARAREAPQQRQGTKTKDPDRYDQVVSLLRTWGGDDYPIRGDVQKNRAAINACDTEIQLLAQAYWRMRSGDWDDAVVQRQGSLAAVVANIGGYEFWESEFGGS